MALITCPECNKEVSDKAKNCIYCGCPLQERQSEQEVSVSSNADRPIETVFIMAKNRISKVRIPIIIGVIVVSVAILAYVFISVIPNGKYNDALSMLEHGKYEEASVLLDQLGNFKNSETIREQIKYESIAYTCIDDWKQNLKNPDSFTPYEIEFYLGENSEDVEKPSCIIYYGAQNGFGGNSTGYVLYRYSKDDEKYILTGYTDTLDVEELNKNDDDYAVYAIGIVLIEACKENGTKVGDIDMSRLKTVLKNDAYSTIKIID